MRHQPILFIPLLVACAGDASWSFEAWGEEYAEQGIPAEAFSDDCSVVFDEALVNITSPGLVSDNGEVEHRLDDAYPVDLVPAGPHPVGSLDVPAGSYSGVRYAIGPSTETGSTIDVVGTLSCAGKSADLDWSFSPSVTYTCDTPLELGTGEGSAVSQATFHLDHLFYDSLDGGHEVGLQGQPILDADADEDGVVTLEELAEVPVADIGYDVAAFSEITTLAGFIELQATGIGHLDGEGHCRQD